MEPSTVRLSKAPPVRNARQIRAKRLRDEDLIPGQRGQLAGAPSKRQMAFPLQRPVCTDLPDGSDDRKGEERTLVSLHAAASSAMSHGSSA